MIDKSTVIGSSMGYLNPALSEKADVCGTEHTTHTIKTLRKDPTH
jgi:hypothetical protein